MQRLNAGKGWHKRKKPVQGKWATGLIAVLFIGTGTALGNISQHYGEFKDEELKAAALAAIQEANAQAEAAAHKIKEETARAEESTKAASTAPETEEETESLPKPYEPAPDKLNLAYFYPEDAESEEIIDSYAGKVFQELMVLDLDWLSDLYELSDVSPSTMASRLGKGTKAVMGGYNPRDKAHRANNPSSWVIHDWKKIHVNFINGDGKAIDGFSNVKDILSMASVYTYFSDMMDVDTFSEYSRQLWKNSHSYSLSMGDLYYCSGCLNKTEEELVREAEEEEFAAEAMSFGMNGQAGRTSGQNSLPSGEIWEGGVSGVQGSAARGLTESSAAGTTAAQADSSMTQAESVPAETTAAQASSMAQAESVPEETAAAQASSIGGAGIFDGAGRICSGRNCGGAGIFDRADGICAGRNGGAGIFDRADRICIGRIIGFGKFCFREFGFWKFIGGYADGFIGFRELGIWKYIWKCIPIGFAKSYGNECRSCKYRSGKRKPEDRKENTV